MLEYLMLSFFKVRMMKMVSVWVVAGLAQANCGVGGFLEAIASLVVTFSLSQSSQVFSKLEFSNNLSNLSHINNIIRIKH